MAKKAKKSTKKQQKKALPKQTTKPTKPSKQAVQPPVKQEPAPQPQVVVETKAEPLPAAIMMLPRKHVVNAVAQIGRYVVHQSRNAPDEYTITDTMTCKPIANAHHNVPLSVIAWMCECAEFIQLSHTMPEVVKGHGMTNARVFAESATALVLSKQQLPDPSKVVQQ